MKVLFLTTYPIEGPVERFRYIQYFNKFRQFSIEPIFHPLINSKLYRIKNKKGAIFIFLKIFLFIPRFLLRIYDIITSFTYDSVIISREIIPFGPIILEPLLFYFQKKVIFDFDDAIFAEGKYFGKWRSWWYNGNKAQFLINRSSIIIAGNKFLADYARHYNDNVNILPTGVDMNKFCPPPDKEENERPIVGWVGTKGGLYLVQELLPLLRDLSKEIKFTFKVIGPSNVNLEIPSGIDFVYEIWSMANEIDSLRTFDIGIMPLGNEVVDLGKCSFKVIQYMACGIPPIASNIGMNKDVIEDGVTGFLVNNKEEWIYAFRKLLNDQKLRHTIGNNARERIQKTFSSEIIGNTFSNIILNCLNK